MVLLPQQCNGAGERGKTRRKRGRGAFVIGSCFGFLVREQERKAGKLKGQREKLKGWKGNWVLGAGD